MTSGAGEDDEGSEPSTLAAALMLRGDEQLTALLRARPDVAVPPPSDFDVLASRLSSHYSVNRAAETVDEFVLQVLEALVVASLSEDDLVVFTAAPREAVHRAVAAAEDLALLWRGGDGLLHTVSGVKAGVGGYPLGLGRPIEFMLRGVPQPICAQIAADLGLDDARPPVPSIAAHFARPEVVRALVDTLPEVEQALLHKLAAGPPVGETNAEVRFVPLAEADTMIERLVAQGLLVALDVDEVELPREVGIALRGDHPAGRLQPVPPPVAGKAVDPADSDGDGASSALEAVRLIEALLERWDAEPPTLTKAGGLPVRELRGATKALGITPETAALLITLVAAAQLAGRTPGLDPQMVPTELYDRWLDQSLPERWALLATSWAAMDQLPGLAVTAGTGTKGAALLTYELVRPGSSELRRDVLGAMAAAGPAVAAERAALAPWLKWRSPTRSAAYVDQVIDWTLTEAAFLGVLGRGALTSAGRVLILSEHATAARLGDEAAARELRHEVADAIAPALPEPIEHVLIQNDLTAVAPGPLRPPVARELAMIADIESAGTATVYRFSESSIRRAFDVGRTALEVRQLVERLARGGVPQGLTYLIDDIGRRHGRLRAGHAGSYLRSDDPALLAEVVANRQAASAALQLIAPTVAVSPLEPAQVLAVLRSSGYAPAGDRTARNAPIELGGRGHRVPVGAARGPAGGWNAGPTLPANHLAQTVSMLRRMATLRQGRARAETRPQPGQLVETPGEIMRLLREGAEDSSAVWISYVNAEGRISERTIYPTLVSGGHAIGLDDDSGERRTFVISRIRLAGRV